MIYALLIGASVALATVAPHGNSVAITGEEINPNASEITTLGFEEKQYRTSTISGSGEQINSKSLNSPGVFYAQVKKPGPGKSGPGKAGPGKAGPGRDGPDRNVDRDVDVDIDIDRDVNVRIIDRDRGWRGVHWGAVVFGVTLGVLIATEPNYPPPPPDESLCWTWTNSAKTEGFWYYCDGD